MALAIGILLFTSASAWPQAAVLVVYGAAVDLWQRFVARPSPLIWLLPDALVFGWFAYETGGVSSPGYLLFVASAAWSVAAETFAQGGFIGLGLGAAFGVAALLHPAWPERADSVLWVGLIAVPALTGALAAAFGSLLRQEHQRVLEHGKVADELRVLEQLKSDFLSTVSHEFRTPLTAIKVSVGLLTDKEGALDEGQQRLMSTIVRNVDRLSQMIGGVLEMARLQSGQVILQRSRADICQVVREMAGSLQPLIDQKDQVLSLELPDTPLLLFVDVSRLEQILSNLLSNAHRYVPRGGEISVQVREVGRWVRIYVKDTGPGVPYAELPHIFDKFYRGQVGRKAGPGTGLGLAIARSLARLHGGDVGVHTKPGEGCIFFVTLPREETVEIPGSR
ncbi:MAG: HAMP domain-containing histidine kinase [Chloroflexi bacterium]|nr:HAMP domain-containing histidine kinase [Chloroflexota bacterium]